MKELNPAKVAAASFIFLVVLYFTSGLDFAIAAVLISLVFLFRLPSAWLFICAFIAFASYLVLNFLVLKLDFIADLTLSSYALFLAGLILYYIQGQQQRWRLILPFAQKVNITRIDLVKTGGVLFFAFLIYPVTNAYMAAIFGYLAFLFIFKKNDGRYAFAIALFFLILCPFLLIGKKDKIAENSAIFTYYFLVIGVVQEVINLIREPKAEEEVEELQVIKSESYKEKEEKLSHLERVKRAQMQTEKEKFGNLPNVFLAGLLSFLVTSGVFYIILKTGIPKIDYFAKNQIKYSPIPSVFPAITSRPAATAVPALVIKVTTDSARLKIFVQNGTDIQGLAASTAAKLKKVGFLDVDIGNAPNQDYVNWELATKEKKNELGQLFKNILDLTELRSSEATIPAGFEVLIITGEKK